MSDYFQPDFFKFSNDSFLLLDSLNCNHKSGIHVLDLFAGCGVVGIEFALKNSSIISSLTFCEIQNIFIDYIKFNIKKYLIDEKNNYKIEILNQDYRNLDRKFDLIIGNPPYYELNNSQLALNENRRICKTFIHGNWKDLLTKTLNFLTDDGQAYYLFKVDKLENMKRIIFDWQMHIKEDAKLELVNTNGLVGVIRLTLL